MHLRFYVFPFFDYIMPNVLLPASTSIQSLVSNETREYSRIEKKAISLCKKRRFYVAILR